MHASLLSRRHFQHLHVFGLRHFQEREAFRAAVIILVFLWYLLACHTVRLL